MSTASDVNIFGIYPMLYAFFTSNNLLDRNAHRKQVNACIAAGAHGLAALAAFGEQQQGQYDKKGAGQQVVIADEFDQMLKKLH